MKIWEYEIGRRVYNKKDETCLSILGVKVYPTESIMLEVAGELGWELVGVVNMISPDKPLKKQELYPTTYFFFKRPKGNIQRRFKRQRISLLIQGNGDFR